MAKTIAVSDEAYELMKNSKINDESFSELIKRSLKRRPSLASIAGKETLSKDDWKKAQEAIKKAESKTEKELSESR